MFEPFWFIAYVRIFTKRLFGGLTLEWSELHLLLRNADNGLTYTLSSPLSDQIQCHNSALSLVNSLHLYVDWKGMTPVGFCSHFQIPSAKLLNYVLSIFF